MCENCGCKPLARSRVYEFLALAFVAPEPALPELMRQQLTPAAAYLESLQDQGSLGAIKALAPALEGLTAAGLEEAYAHCFGHTISKECPPYEAEYGQAHIFQQSQALADIAGFYRAFGLELHPNLKDRLDHIAVELEFMQFLCLKEAYALTKGHSQDHLALCREAQAKFLGEHLGQWGLGFIQKLEEKAGATLYGRLARLLRAFLTLELRRQGLEPGKVREPSSIEAPEEEAPGCESCPLVPAAGRGMEL